MTFIAQSHIGVLFQILCVFSEHLPTLGQCLYIWSIMYILSYSRKRCLISINEGFRIFIYFDLFKSHPIIQTHPFTKFLIKQWPPPIYQDPSFIRSLRVCTLNVIYVLSVQLKCLQVNIIMQMIFKGEIFQQMLPELLWITVQSWAVDFKIQFPNYQRRTHTRGIFVYILFMNVPF